MNDENKAARPSSESAHGLQLNIQLDANAPYSAVFLGIAVGAEAKPLAMRQRYILIARQVGDVVIVDVLDRKGATDAIRAIKDSGVSGVREAAELRDLQLGRHALGRKDYPAFFEVDSQAGTTGLLHHNAFIAVHAPRYGQQVAICMVTNKASPSEGVTIAHVGDKFVEVPPMTTQPPDSWWVICDRGSYTAHRMAAKAGLH